MSLTGQLLVSAKCVADAKHAVLTLVKFKHRAPEMRLNQCLIYFSRLEKMCVELEDSGWTRMALSVVAACFGRNMVWLCVMT